MFQRTCVGRGIAAWLMVAALWPAAARGQGPIAQGGPDPATVHVQIGPLWISPAINLSNAGIDTNVFDVADSDHPQSDFMVAVTPQATLWLRVGRSWVSSIIREDLVWYSKFASERSATAGYSLGWVAPLTRVTLTMDTSWLHTRERPGFEIDLRAHRSERAYNGAVELRVLSRMLIGVRGDRRATNFDEKDVFLGSNLREDLNRTQTTGALTVRHELTPLTNLTLDVSRQQDRFEFSPLRDSNSTQLALGLKFAPDALISGTAQFGYRNFEPLAPDLPGYTGGTAAVNVGYAFRSVTKVSVQGTRDVQYSFDINQPYYLLTGMAGSVTQQIFGPADVEGRVGRQRLVYTAREGVVTEVAGQVDHVQNFGVGVGYRMGRDLRLGLNVDHQARTSVAGGRSYSGLRYGTAMTYVF